MPDCYVRTYKLAVPSELNAICERLNKEAARIYNKTMSLIRKTKDKKGFWLSEGTVQKYILRWYEGIDMHTHSKQAIMQRYFQALRSYFANIKSNPNAKPPYKRRRYVPFIWKSTAIKLLEDGTLRLSMGGKAEPLEIKTNLIPDTVIKQAALVYDSGRYYLHLAIEVEKQEQAGSNVMAVDLGVLRPITTFYGVQVVIYNGGVLSSVLRYRNKEYAKFQQMLSKCKEGSKRYKKLNRAKRNMLRKTSNQIKDIMHKITSHFIGMCLKKNVGTIVLGELTNIRENVEGNDNAKQKIHQWQFRKLTQMIEHKAELFGISVIKISEAYTSKTCPVCGVQNKPNGRNYRCQSFGFEYHRDGVEAINIYKRYLGDIPVVEGLASSVGVRYNPHLRGHGFNTSPWKVAISY
ncbi:MAG: RNA-guided endonuclease InsQ/TnpB family protein [Fervidobacterium sp.]|uniref:RNA-guided endonuclease InsQ/TnpB family protein n=1 Tax=Fervidobacterium sp. TaxID=1871331 RepID=UPI00404B5341